MLNLQLNRLLEDSRGPRPRNEIDDLVSESIEILRKYPYDYYDKIEEIGEGGYGKVYKIRRKRDKQIFALKSVPKVEDYELSIVIREASLLSYLNCKEIIECEELYYYHRTVYIVLELMDQGCMTDICLYGNDTYPEEFCRYSLYKVALGL